MPKNISIINSITNLSLRKGKGVIFLLIVFITSISMLQLLFLLELLMLLFAGFTGVNIL